MVGAAGVGAGRGAACAVSVKTRTSDVATDEAPAWRPQTVLIYLFVFKATRGNLSRPPGPPLALTEQRTPGRGAPSDDDS